MRKKERTRIIVLATVVASLIISVIVYSVSIRKFFIKQADYSVEQNVKNVKKEMETLLGYGRSSIQLTSQMVSQTMTEKELKNGRDVMDPLLEKTPFDFVDYVRWDGKITGGHSSFSEEFMMQESVYFREGMKGSTGIWVDFSRASSKSVLINFYTPLWYGNEISGVLTGAIQSEENVHPLLSSSFFGHSTVGVLLDSNFSVIASNHAAIPVGMHMEKWRESPEIRRLMENASERKEVSFNFEYEGRNCVACVARLDSIDWFVLQIVPGRALKEAMHEINLKTYGFAGFVLLALIIYILVMLVSLHNRNVETEKSQLNIINALCISYQNVYLINLVTKELFIYHLTGVIDAKYGKIFAAGNYDSNIKLYCENEVYKEDRGLFARIDTIEKVREIFEGQNEYSFTYRVLRNGEIQFYQCYLTKPDEGDEFVAAFKNVDDVVDTETKLNQLMESQVTQLSIMSSISGIYLTLHLIDIENDTLVEFNSVREVNAIINSHSNAGKQMYEVMKAVCYPECLNDALDFTELSTLKERMRGKGYISIELNGPYHGWFRASFIKVEGEEDGNSFKVLFATQIINDEKKKEATLISDANTDELTGFFNRRAYEDELEDLRKRELKDSFVYLSLDVNGLKNVNDTLGHVAGDELLKGAAGCIANAFGKYGKIYRTGGDEFQVIMAAGKEEFQQMLDRFTSGQNSWKGKYVESLAISLGCVTGTEAKGMNIDEIIKLADRRMYDAKAAYYAEKGIDRRGQKAAFEVLCAAYTKILRINLTKDDFAVIQMREDEIIPAEGNEKKFSAWIRSYGNSENIHEEDREKFLKMTDSENLQKFFSEGNNNFSFEYRRKIGQNFMPVILEILKAKDYSQENQNLFLYVKDVETSE